MGLPFAGDPSLLGQNRINAVTGDHHVRVQLVSFGRFDAGDRPVLFDDVRDGDAGEKAHPGLFGFFGEPAVERRSDDGIAVGGFGVVFRGLIADLDAGLFRQDKDALLHDRALQRAILPKFRNNIFEHLGIKDGALHVFGAGVLAALQQRDRQPRAGHRDGRGDPRGPRSNDNGVKFIFSHRNT